MKRLLIAILLAVFVPIGIAFYAVLTVLLAFFQSPQELTNSIGMKFRRIASGSYLMGTQEHPGSPKIGEQIHRVTINQPFYLGVYEVTQAQYERIMGTNPSFYQAPNVQPAFLNQNQLAPKSDTSDHPVEKVSWEDATEFCKRLSDLADEKAAGRIYHLPTEAQWEYACRAGTKSSFSFDDESKVLGEYGWYWENSRGQTHPVGELKPNAWGLYDMHGNVSEWCLDWFDQYPETTLIDPTGPAHGTYKVHRGGGWFVEGSLCSSASRDFEDPKSRLSVGFRVAASVRASK